MKKVLLIEVQESGQVVVTNGTERTISSTVEGALTKLGLRLENEAPADYVQHAGEVIEGLLGEVRSFNQLHEGLLSG